MASSIPSYLQIQKLEGTKNYSTWKLRMKSVLINQGLWYVTSRPNETEVKDDNWISTNERAYSLILLMINDNVAKLVYFIEDAHTLWLKLEQLYGQAGFSARHLTFQGLYSTRLDSEPSVEAYIDKIKQYTLELV